MDPITLLAMAPSGETYLARDRGGRIWLIQPLGAGENEVVDTDLVERAVADGGFDRIDAQFNSWEELDRFRQERAALVVPDIVVDRDRLDAEDVDEMLAVVRKWIDGGERARARRATFAFLKLPIARTEATIHERLVAILEELERPLMRFQSQPVTATQRAARDRWDAQERLAA
jgi:hypothetical protein